MLQGRLSIMRRPFLALYKRTVELRSTGFNLVAIDLALARRLALSVVLGQAAVTVICALAAWMIAGSHAALSALLGGGISAVSSVAMALLGFGRRSTLDPQRMMRTFFVGRSEEHT